MYVPSCKFSCSIFSFNQVFRFYNIPHLFIDGDMSYEARANITSKFTCDPSIRVLFFSSVGAIGLNLSVANIVVFLVCYAVHHTRTSYSDPLFRNSFGMLRMSYKLRIFFLTFVERHRLCSRQEYHSYDGFFLPFSDVRRASAFVFQTGVSLLRWFFSPFF